MVAVAPIAIVGATSATAEAPSIDRVHAYDIVQSAAINPWQPNLFQTLDQVQKLGVTGVDILIPAKASDTGTTGQEAIVVAKGIAPTAAQQPTASAVQIPANPYQAQLDAILKQLAETLAKLLPPKPPLPKPPIIPADAKQLFVGDYNTGGLGQWAMLQATGVNGPPPPNYCTYSVCVRNGGVGHETAARFEVRDGDVPPFGGGERAEVSAAPWHASKTANVKEGDERWYAFSLKFDDTWQNPRHGPSSWFVVTQWLSENPATDGPRLTLNVTPDNYLELGGASEAVPYRRKIAPIRPGQWEDYVLHVKFSSDPNAGFVEVYQNGNLVVPKQYRPTLADDGYGARFKQGVYRDAESTGTQVVWHDGMTIYEGSTPPPSVAAAAARSADAQSETGIATTDVVTTEDETTTEDATADQTAPDTATAEPESDSAEGAEKAAKSEADKDSRSPSTTASVNSEPGDNTPKAENSTATGPTAATPAAKQPQDTDGAPAAGSGVKNDSAPANDSKPAEDSGAAGS